MTTARTTAGTAAGPVTTLVDRPGLAAETDALLARLAADEAADDAADEDEPVDVALAGRPDPRARAEDRVLALPGRDLPARVYRGPGAGPRPVLLWLHGGGFVGGSFRDLEYATSRLAVAGGVVVVALDYRLAPAWPYPHALDDVVDTLRGLAAGTLDLGDASGDVDAGDGRLAVGGQSAGAALAAGACLRLCDEDGAGGPAGVRIGRQVLCYPVLDVGQDTASFRAYDGVFHSIAPARWRDGGYYPDGDLPAYAVPLRAASLAGLPPALVLAAGRDPLRDDARTYAARLARDGVPARLVEYAGTMHAFVNFPGALTAGRHAVDLVATDLAAFAATGTGPAA